MFFHLCINSVLGKKESKKNPQNTQLETIKIFFCGLFCWYFIVIFFRIRTQYKKDGKSFNHTGPLETPFLCVLCNRNRGCNTIYIMIRTHISQPELGSMLITSIETTPSSFLNSATIVCVALESNSYNPINYPVSLDIISFS